MTIMIKIFLVILLSLLIYETYISLYTFKKQKELILDHTITNTILFGILIACHNEESVIVSNLESISNSDNTNYEINIFADNCSDNTVVECERFKQHHQSIKLNIFIVNGGSKPKALNQGIQLLKDNNMWVYDSIIILDADNKVSSTMLSSYNYHHKLYDILQCRIVSDNDDSLIARSFTASFNITTYRRQICRNNANLSGSLSGTGFSINRKVFDLIDFQNCNTLTEDLEFSILAILRGYMIKFIPTEYVLNQNLDNLKPSLIQRIRWCRGHAQVSNKLSTRLITEFIKCPSLQLIDSFLFINSPYIITFGGIIFGYTFITRYNYPNWMILSFSIITMYQVLYSFYCNKWKLKYIISEIHYSICMYWCIVIGTLTRKNMKWVKTNHVKIDK